MLCVCVRPWACKMYASRATYDHADSIFGKQERQVILDIADRKYVVSVAKVQSSGKKKCSGGATFGPRPPLPLQ